MVDALNESWRVLHSHGVLLDFRPLFSSSPIEIVNGAETQEIGAVDDSAALSDSAAADAAIRTVVESGIFRPLSNTRFETMYYWDRVKEMSEYLTSRRHRMGILPSETQVRNVFDRTARVDTTVRLCCRWRTQLNTYQKDAAATTSDLR
jgi:hypothetical protein